jgi:beta-glucosidase
MWHTLTPRRASRTSAVMLMFMLATLASTAIALPQATPPVATPPPLPPAHSAVTPAARDGWAHERFLAINETIKSMKQVDVILLGDSITQGWEAEGQAAWEAHFSLRRAVNLGIGGDRTQNVLWRLENGNVAGIRPQLAILMIGTNNSNGDDNSVAEIADGITAIVKTMRRKLPKTKILLLGIFPRGEQPNHQRGKLLQVNQIISKLHDGQSIHYMDIGHVFVNADGSISPDIMPDGLHLSPRGYELWAQTMEPTLQVLVK